MEDFNFLILLLIIKMRTNIFSSWYLKITNKNAKVLVKYLNSFSAVLVFPKGIDKQRCESDNKWIQQEILYEYQGTYFTLLTYKCMHFFYYEHTRIFLLYTYKDLIPSSLKETCMWKANICCVFFHFLSKSIFLHIYSRIEFQLLVTSKRNIYHWNKKEKTQTKIM